MDAEVAKSDSQAIQLKCNLFTLTVVELHSTNEKLLRKELAKKVEQAPKFFQQTPVVIGLDKLKKEIEVDFPQLTALLREYGMIPLAVRGAAEKDKESIIDAGLAHFNELKEGENDKSVAVETPKLALPAANDASISEESIRPTKIVNQRVRSGQQVTASGCDLIVVGAVSEGAELKADGNVHIYGNLRGRVHAGGQGNKEARVFCHQLHAQFVSIAGVHAVSDSFPQELWGEAAQIYLSNGKLVVEPI